MVWFIGVNASATARVISYHRQIKGHFVSERDGGGGDGGGVVVVAVVVVVGWGGGGGGDVLWSTQALT